MTSRRLFVSLAAIPLLLAGGCTSVSLGPERPPIVFVHGNGESAAIWQTTIWRFESNGWARRHLHAVEIPYPLARDDDTKEQPGRSSAAAQLAFLKAEVEKVLKTTGATQVILIGNSSGGYPIRNYIQNAGGDKTVSHAVLGGTPNHGAYAIKGYNEGSQFAGTGPFLTALNAPKNAAGDEVAGPVKWMTIRSDSNDKYAQPDGLWLGARGTPTNITFAGPELQGATNIVIPRIDHRETSFSAAAFDAAFRFITGFTPTTTDVSQERHILLRGRITGLGVSPTDRTSGDFPNNLPVPGAQLQVFATDPATGERRGAAVYSNKTLPDGRWGPFVAEPGRPYEFVISAPGYATTHIYRSPFPRSSNIVNMRPERVPDADKHAPALAIMVRPRGYLDPGRDKMAFDGQSPPPGAVLGAGVASSRIKPVGLPRAITAEFNGERVTGRTWPLAENHVSVLELTY